jgi:hypothetical protein
MLLNKGQLDGKRILQEKTVALMTKNQLPKEAIPIGVHADATIAPAIPPVAPATAARNGAAQAAAVACRGVMPGARRICRSDTVAEA